MPDFLTMPLSLAPDEGNTPIFDGVCRDWFTKPAKQGRPRDSSGRFVRLDNESRDMV